MIRERMYDIIRSPVVTEKSTQGTENYQVTFRVSRDATKPQVKTAVEGLYMATVHYRNGILFAPVTAEDVASVILTGVTSPTIAPFGIDRFS